MSKYISSKKFGFLDQREIYDVVSITQQCIHSFKTHQLEACLMRINLIKAYDYVAWELLRLILHKIGFVIKLIDWIMVCISTVSYVVIINGLPTFFFNASRGLRQGCALSPLLFFIVTDGLSRRIKEGHSMGIISICRISRKNSLIHLMFVDGFLLLGISLWLSIAKFIHHSNPSKYS